MFSGGPIAQNPGFVEGHTFEGNPVSCAAGIAVLREIIERDLLANARTQGERLRAGFDALARKYSVIGDMRGKGLVPGHRVRARPRDQGPLRGTGRPSASGSAAGPSSTGCSAGSTPTGSRSAPRWS